MSRLEDVAQSLLWSLWSELGVPGQERRHRAVAVDPEPLIAWTPFLAARDPRLLGLAFDWCVVHAAHITKVRFPGLVRSMPNEAAAALASFNGALARHGIDWRPAAAPMALDVTRSRMALPTERPALVRFRIRALCGTSARAEVLAALLACGDRGAQTAELTPSGLTRRSVERVLDDLVTANLLATTGRERRRTFRLRDPRALERTVQASGLRSWPDWHRAFTLVASLAELAMAEHVSEGVRRVDAARRWQKLEELALTLRLEAPPGPVGREDVFDALVEWGWRVVGEL